MNQVAQAVLCRPLHWPEAVALVVLPFLLFSVLTAGVMQSLKQEAPRPPPVPAYGMVSQ